MNTNPLVMAALTGIGVPVSPDEGIGDGAEYITFNDSDNSPGMYASNVDITQEAIVQVHHWLKKENDANPKPRCKEIRRRMRAADFLYIGTPYASTDDGYYHTVTEWKITQECEEDDD